MRKVFISQYYGVISCRVYDEELKKNIAKIDISNLEEFLTKKVANKKITKQKGNALFTIKI